MLAASAGDISDDNLDDHALQDGGEDESASESESDDESWSCPDFVWKKAAQDLPYLHPFSGNPGIKVDTSGFSPDKYFQLFVTDDLLNHFTIQTNLFAEQYIQSHPNSTFQHAQVGSNYLLLIMGVVKKPEITPLFGAVMARNRFLLLLKFFHVNDNRNAPQPDDIIIIPYILAYKSQNLRQSLAPKVRGRLIRGS